jgi:hypothetical protein
MRRGKKLGAFNYRVQIHDDQGMAHLTYLGVASQEDREDSCLTAFMRIVESDPTRIWEQPEIVNRLSGSFTERQVKYTAKYAYRKQMVDLEPSKGGKPTLIRLRTPISPEQPPIKEDWVD